MTKNAAENNETILALYKYDLTRMIPGHPSSHISYGSEFRPWRALAPLLHLSPHWADVKDTLSNGARYPLQRLSPKRRLQDLEEAIIRGNHKSATDSPNILDKLIKKDVDAGFQLPTTINSLRLMPHAVVAPYGVIKQNTIDTEGNIIPKLRIAHDQSFCYSSGTSVNSRVNKDELTTLIYGDALRRLLHYIHSLRFHHPLTPILIGKYDFASAYRRMTNWGHTAASSCTIHNDIAYISLRLTFGGSPCPFKWCSMSELITDLANDLLSCPDWDHEKVHSPHKPSIPPPVILPSTSPFSHALPVDVIVPPKKHGLVESYIDDLIPVVLHNKISSVRAANAVPLAMHIIGRPVHPDEPIKREDLLCFRKLAGEGQMSEIKTVTGWGINTRRLVVSLTDDKFSTWTSSINAILKKGFTDHDEMESVVGRLNHCGYIIPHARHFLHPLRAILTSNHKKSHPLSTKEKKYLQIWQSFLSYANRGISINNIVYRRPTHIRWDDSCPIGIGGVSVKGLAYRYHLPRPLQGRVSNNALEFLASTVGCWLDYLNGEIPPLSCILALTDSSSACGWLHKSSFTSSDHSFHAEVAELLATIFIDADSSLYSQHFAGSLNVIADSLSRDHHLSDSQLSQLLHHHFPQQVPPNFTISPLPPTIISWINCRLREQPETTPEHVAQMPSSIGRGVDGRSFSLAPNSRTTSSSITSATTTKSESLGLLPKPCENANFPEQVQRIWRAGRAGRPWTKWRRSFGQTVGATPAMTNPETSTTASTSNTAVIPPPTLQPNKKRQSLPPSFANTTTVPPPQTKKL